MAGMELTRHQAVFGPASVQAVREIVDRHLRELLGSGIDRILFEAGAIGAVFGVQVVDGRQVVVKAYQPSSDLERLELVAQCQRLLRDRGFPCAAILSPPEIGSGVPMVVEELLQRSSIGSPHDPVAVSAMAAGLAEQVRLLRDVRGERLNTGRPGWTNWETGAWPTPHVPIFDFSEPAAGYEWVDRRADTHAAVLRRQCQVLAKVVGHTDWVWQNVVVRDGRLAAGFDWDSLAYLPEAVVAGLGAGAYCQGSPIAPDAPAWRQVIEFLSAYERARDAPFSPDEAQAATHAAGWVRCYNARCQLDNQQRRGMAPPAGSFIEMMTTDDFDPS